MFKLPAELTIVKAEECKSQFIEYVEQHSEISLDDSDVSRVDTVGVQLLLAIVTYVVSQNKPLNWQNQSSIIKQSIKQLGLNEEILNQYIDA